MRQQYKKQLKWSRIEKSRALIYFVECNHVRIIPFLGISLLYLHHFFFLRIYFHVVNAYQLYVKRIIHHNGKRKVGEWTWIRRVLRSQSLDACICLLRKETEIRRIGMLYAQTQFTRQRCFMAHAIKIIHLLKFSFFGTR